MTPGRQPPKWLERRLERRLPPDFRGVIAGDLAEEYAERAGASGRLAATLWYAGQVMRVDASALERATTATNGTWARDEGRPTAERITGSGMMDTMLQDIRFAVRRLWKSPGFTVVAVLTLGLGIGANSAMFTLVNAIFRQDDGIVEADRVTRVYWDGRNPYWSISWDWYRRFSDELPEVFSHTSAYRMNQARSSPTGDALLTTLNLSGDYFGTTGVRPLLGRGFDPGIETDVENGEPVVVLSHGYWRSVLGSDPEVIGQTIRVNAQPHTVIGVLPDGFAGPLGGVGIDLYLPDHGAVQRPGTDNLIGAARLQPGVTLEMAEAGLARVAQALNAGRPSDRTPVAFTLIPESEIAIDPGADQLASRMLALLFAVVGLVLVIACTNLASFLLARAADRRREFAVRRAIGAGRGRVVGQLLVESLLLAVFGGVVGIGLAQFSLRALQAIELPLGLQLTLETGIDPFVLGGTLAVTALAGVLFGLFPALTAGREELATVLRNESGGAAGGRGKVSLRGTLVVAQVSLSLVLLMGAGLFVRSLLTMTSIDPGFDRSARAMIDVSPGDSGYEFDDALLFMDRALDVVRAMPDVEVATMASRVPMEPGIWRAGIRRSDQAFSPTEEFTFPQVTYTADGYFETLDIELLAGRTVGPDDRAGTPPVVVVNEALAAQLWPGAGRDIVGRSVFLSYFPDSVATVVGLAPNVKVTTLDEAPVPLMYVPQRQARNQQTTIVARGRDAGRGETGAQALAERMREEIKRLDPDMYVHSATTVAKATDATLLLPRIGALALATFGGLAVLMAALGLYGLVAFGVKRREKEVGIRLSLGADPREVVRLLMGDGLRLVAIGVAIGLGLGVLGGLALEGFLFGISGRDPVTLIAVPALLIVVALAASWLPARKAAGIDPVESLRRE